MTEVTPSIKVYDAATGKWVFVASGGGTGGGGGGGHVIQSDGTDVAARDTLNFSGTGVTVTDNATDARTDVVISGGGTDVAGTPVEGALVAWDGAETVWAIPTEITAADIPYNETASIAEAFAALSARVTALETTGPPVANTTRPSITGTYQVGQTITTTNGSWAPTPDSYTYQWRRVAVPISGATSANYSLVSADIGTSTITCAVTAVKAGYSSAVAAADPITVSAAPPSPLSIVGANSQGAQNSSLTRTVACPTGVEAGDLMLLVGVSASSTDPMSIGGITGWTSVLSRTVSGHDAQVWSRTATGTEGGTNIVVTVPGPLVLKVSLAIIVLRSAGGALAVKQKPYGGSTGGTSGVTPTVITTQASYELMLGITSTGDATTAQTITQPSGQTLITSCVSVGTTGGRTSIVAAYPTLTMQNAGVTFGGDTYTWVPGSGHTDVTLAIGYS